MVAVRLPGLLASILGGTSSIEIEAETLGGVLERLVERKPELRTHLFDETGELRQHVLCFHNETNTRWLEDRDVAVRDGDTVTILQAVSGG